jgi:hypothetical protein
MTVSGANPAIAGFLSVGVFFDIIELVSIGDENDPALKALRRLRQSPRDSLPSRT